MAVARSQDHVERVCMGLLTIECSEGEKCSGELK